MIGQFNSLFVVEFSFQQNAFHVSTVAEMLAANASKFARHAPNDYMPLAIVPTYDEAAAVVAKLRPAADQLIASELARRAERIREELGVVLSLSDFGI